jgi:hypothetical protein
MRQIEREEMWTYEQLHGVRERVFHRLLVGYDTRALNVHAVSADTDYVSLVQVRVAYTYSTQNVRMYRVLAPLRSAALSMNWLVNWLCRAANSSQTQRRMAAKPVSTAGCHLGGRRQTRFPRTKVMNRSVMQAWLMHWKNVSVRFGDQIENN